MSEGVAGWAGTDTHRDSALPQLVGSGLQGGGVRRGQAGHVRVDAHLEDVQELRGVHSGGSSSLRLGCDGWRGRRVGRAPRPRRWCARGTARKATGALVSFLCEVADLYRGDLAEPARWKADWIPHLPALADLPEHPSLLELQFSDAANRRWIRDSQGVLSRIEPTGTGA
jgi:hypothetical protein